MNIGGFEIGAGRTFIVAEIGINHNGDIGIAKQLIDAAKSAGADAVKFQKRVPELCVPRAEWYAKRKTPWGEMTYLDYKKRMEFDFAGYAELANFCRVKDILWFASCWDIPSVNFIRTFKDQTASCCYKIASACLANDELLKETRKTGKPVMLSTGMSTWAEVNRAVDILGCDNLILMHARSTYPAAVDELNLKMIPTLAARYGVPVGYSGHETGLTTTVVAVALGACVIERHITLDRAMWGTDQAASVEAQGFARLVKDIRNVERAMGDGQRREYESENESRRKLRGDI